jgi:hypothetical protein
VPFLWVVGKPAGGRRLRCRPRAKAGLPGRYSNPFPICSKITDHQCSGPAKASGSRARNSVSKRSISASISLSPKGCPVLVGWGLGANFGGERCSRQPRTRRPRTGDGQHPARLEGQVGNKGLPLPTSGRHASGHRAVGRTGAVRELAPAHGRFIPAYGRAPVIARKNTLPAGWSLPLLGGHVT